MGRRLWGSVRSLRNSAPSRIVAAVPGTIGLRARHRAGAARHFDISARMGMGAVVNHAVRLLTMAERLDIVARLGATNPLYATTPGHDWFGDFFTQRHAPAGDLPVTRIRNEWDYQLVSAHTVPTLSDARRLFDHHLAFTAAVDAELAAVVAAIGPLDAAVGVHYRGTDKRLEAASTGHATMCRAIEAACTRAGCDRIFVATDEPAFENVVADAFPDCTIVTYNHQDVTRVTGTPVHFGTSPGYAKGMEAVLLIRLLASCGMLVRTPSYLSAWAQILADDQPALLVNFQGMYLEIFPDGALLRSTDYAAM